MQTKLSDLLDAKDSGPLTATLPFKDSDFRVTLRHASAEERRRFYARSTKGGKTTPNVEDAKRFWCGHVVTWEGLRDGEGPDAPVIEFNEHRCMRLYELDGDFADFVVEESSKLDNFR